jgi:hypothetical protein
VLTVMAKTHVVPRSYLWGFADTIRAGLEGRENPQLFLGKVYNFRAPTYFFPAMIAVKVPIGLLALLLLGLFLFLTRRVPSDWILPSWVVLAVAGLFLPVLSVGATYAGIRHALPVVVLLSCLAGISFDLALFSKTRQLQIIVAFAFLVAAVSAVPQMRPWEYFNEFVGGTANAYKYFSDEGVDLAQRSKELAEYYQRELKPNGLRPVCFYDTSDSEKAARGIDCLGSDKVHDRALIELPGKVGDYLCRAIGPYSTGLLGSRCFAPSYPHTAIGKPFCLPWLLSPAWPGSPCVLLPRTRQNLWRES